MNKMITIIMIVVIIFMTAMTFDIRENSKSISYNNTEIFEGVGFLNTYDATYRETLTVGTTRSFEYTDDGLYVAVGIETANRLKIYEFDVATESYQEYGGFINTGGLGSVYGVDFTSDNKYLAVGHASTPYLQIRDVDSNFSVVVDSDIGVNDIIYDCEFYNDKYLIVGGDFDDYLQVFRYTVDGDFTKLEGNIDVLPTNRVTDIEYNNGYIHVATLDSPYLITYRLVGDNLYKIDNPTNLPEGSAYTVDSTDDGLYIVVGLDVSPYVRVYKFQNETFTDVSLDVIPTQTNITYATHFVDNTFLYVGGETSIYKYKFVDGSLIQQANDVDIVDYPIYVINSRPSLLRLVICDINGFKSYIGTFDVNFDTIELQYNPSEVISVIQNNVNKDYTLIDKYLTVTNEVYNEDVEVKYIYEVDVENEFVNFIPLFAVVGVLFAIYLFMTGGGKKR